MTTPPDAMPPEQRGWRRAFAVYGDRRLLLVLLQGFASGLPLLLVFSTLSAHLAQDHVSRKDIGLLLLVQLPYNFKFIWAPLIDRLPPPIRLGQRRGWGLTIQILLIIAIVTLGHLSPQTDLFAIAVTALLVSFLSASQDVVIDAFRVELLQDWQQGAGAAMTQAGYRIAMLTAGAGALLIADVWGWFAAYATMAALLTVGMFAFLAAPEPKPIARETRSFSAAALWRWIEDSVIDPFQDFMARPGWIAILLFLVGYKLGEAMAGAMATPLYLSLGFSLTEIAQISKLFGFFAILVGGFLGGAAIARLGIVRALLVSGLLQSLGNLFYILQAQSGHNLHVLALCVAAEQLSSGMAGTAMIAYVSQLCRAPFTATQYALLASVTTLGRAMFSASSGALSESLGWVSYFAMTTLVTLPALLLLIWIQRRWPNQPITAVSAENFS